LFKRIFAVGRALDDVPVVELRVKHREAVVMAGRNSDVLHAGGFGASDPGFRIEFFGTEKVWKPLVAVELQSAVVDDPLDVAEHAVNAPMDEEAEFHVLKFLPGF